jgi:hypothetical protein
MSDYAEIWATAINETYDTDDYPVIDCVQDGEDVTAAERRVLTKAANDHLCGEELRAGIAHPRTR